MCDAAYNTEECNWDGGDCCASTCVGSLCGSHGFACKAPGNEDREPEVPS